MPLTKKEEEILHSIVVASENDRYASIEIQASKKQKNADCKHWKNQTP